MGTDHRKKDHLKKDHPIGTGAAALASGAVGAAVGGIIGGPAGMAVGAAAGGAMGAVVGSRTAEAADPRDDLGRFEQIWHTMPYYEDGMEWDDYAPAYRYGIDQYHGGDPRTFQAAEPALRDGWLSARAGSRLEWAQAREAVAHVWRWYDEELHRTEHVPRPR